MKKHCKNISFVLVLTVIMSLLLVGCHGAKESKAFVAPEQFDSSNKYEITFWAKNDTNKNQTDIYEKTIKNFEALYPNIKVNLRLYTDYGKIYNDVITNISTGTTPNVCITYPDHIATYLMGDNQVVPLDELFADEKYGFGGTELEYDAPTRDEMITEYLEECKLNGYYYAIPYMRSTEICYVNKDFVEKLGYTLPETLTWDFVWEVSEAALKKDANGNYELNGQKTLIPFIYKSTDNMMITMLKQQDAGYSTANGDIEIFNDTTSDIIKEIAAHTKSGAFSTFKISGYPANFLNAGQCIFAIDSSAGSTWMGSEAPLCDISEDKLVHFETAVMAIPQYDTSNKKMISQGPSVCIFNKTDEQEVLASWLFAQYLLTNDVQTAYAKTEGYIPVTHKAQDSVEYRDYLARAGEDNETFYRVKIESTKLLIDNIENTFVTPVFNGSTSLREAAGALIEDSVKSVRRKKTVDDKFIEKLYSDSKSLYRLDQISGQNQAAAGNTDLGPLPGEAVALIVGLISVWCLIIAYLLWQYLYKNKKERK